MAEALVLTAAVLIAASIVVTALRTGIGPMPTSPAARAAIVGALPPSLEGLVYELGSGWGGLALAIARAKPACRVVGIELSPVPLLFSKLRLWLSGASNCRFVLADFRGVPLSGAKAVVCYLYRAGMAGLRPKLESELAPGTLVVSHTFSVPGWTPEAVVTAADLWRSPVYVYRRPA